MTRVCAAAWLLLVLHVMPARADVADYLGKPVTAIAIEAEGRSISDQTLLGLLETATGRPLRMRDVRASVAHLFSLGRFADVVVHAADSAGGVAIRYQLVLVHPIDRVAFTGLAGSGVGGRDLRRAIEERFGASPPSSRTEEMSSFVLAQLQGRGDRRAAVTPRLEIQHEPERGTLVFAVIPGTRTRIDRVDVSAPPGVSVAEVIRRLAVSRGSPYLPEALQQRLDQYSDRLKAQGHYNARVTVTPRFGDDDQGAALTVTVEPGPRVRVEFKGDPLPADRRDDLVPIGREGAADEDLLEDSALRIGEFLRGQGYRDATASFTRDEAGGDLVVTFTVSRGPQYRIALVEITGNTAIPLADLSPALRVREGQVFSVTALGAEVSAIQDLYARRGYALARAVPQVEPMARTAATEQVPVAIRIAIAENARTLVTSVRVQGNQSLPSVELTEGLGLQPGQPFFPTQLAIDRDAIQLRYANAGFRNASVSSNPGLGPDGAGAEVVFSVEEGPRVFVDHVLIIGNERTRMETIRRELQFKTGEPLGLAAVTESQRRLATLGLFRRTRITELGHGAETTRDVLVTVEEAPVTTIGYGGGLEAGEVIRGSAADPAVASEELEFAPRAFFEVGRRNLFGKNRSINLFTRISFRPKDFGTQSTAGSDGDGYDFSEYRVIGTYREPRVRGTAADAFLTGTIEQQRRSSFNFARRAFSAELLRRLTRELSATASYQIQRTELFDEKINPSEKLAIDRLFPQLRLSSFSLSGIREGRDDVLDPTTGEYLSANVQVAARVIGSEVGFLKSYFTAQLFRMVPRVRRVVLATSARVGLASGFPREAVVLDESGQPVAVELRDLPASERFFAGGDSTVRGFALDQLGTPATIGEGGFPIGGNALVILNAELRLPVRGGLGLVGFFDTGNVFARTTDSDLAELRSAVGFGIRYKSPVGPIRVDIGFKIHRRDIVEGRKEDLAAVHISLGQAF